MAASAAQGRTQGCNFAIPVHFGFEEKQACKSDWLDLAVLDNATFQFFMGKFSEARDSTAKMDLKHPLARVVEKLVRQPANCPSCESRLLSTTSLMSFCLLLFHGSRSVTRVLV